MGRHHRGPDLGSSPDKDPHGRHGGRGTAKAWAKAAKSKDLPSMLFSILDSDSSSERGGEKGGKEKALNARIDGFEGGRPRYLGPLRLAARLQKLNFL